MQTLHDPLNPRRLPVSAEGRWAWHCGPALPLQRTRLWALRPALRSRPVAALLRALLWALAAALLLSGCASAPPLPGPLARGDYAAVGRHLQAFIAHELRAHEVMGLSIAIVDDQQLVWSHGAGWADQAGGVPASAATVYRMGSISKLLTATAALQLAEQGRLDLDAPMQAALPGFAIRSRYAGATGAQPITARQLMTHHAGLPRDIVQGQWGAAPESLAATVTRLAASDAAYPPGLLMHYSNLGATVLGAAVERLAGVPFEQQLQGAVLAPLGMAGASFSAGVASSPVMAKAYAGLAPADEPTLRDVPAGGLNASVLDMGRFLMMVFAQGRAPGGGGHAVLRPDTLAEMLRVQNAEVPLDLGFGVGLGWMLDSFGSDTLVGGGPVAHHAGATLYFRSQMYALPQQRLGVVVAANSSTAGGVVDAVAKRALALALEAKAGVVQPPPAQSFEPARTPWPDAELQAYVGEYATTWGHIAIWRDGPRLMARALGRELELLPGEQRSLGLRYTLMGLLPVPLGDLSRLALQRRSVAGRDVLVARLGAQQVLVGERLPPPAPAGASALPLALAGSYLPEPAGAERQLLEQVQISADGGRLFAAARLKGQAPVPARQPLLAVEDDGAEHQALLLGPLADAGELVRWRSVDGQPRAHFAGYAFKRVGP